jgi:hypothetical protein
VRKVLLIIVVLLVAFVVVERNRLFVRDPLGSVTRNGVKETGAQVYINFQNDVLVENDNAPIYVELVQAGRPIGPPAELKCVHWMMCLTDADKATLTEASPGASIESMDGKTVRFMDTGGKETVVTLR